MSAEVPIFVELADYSIVQQWHIVRVRKKKKVITVCNRTITTTGALATISETLPDGDNRCPICFVQA